MVLKPLAGIMPVLAALLGPEPALAHAFLAKADPAVGSTIPASPSTLSLQFTEGVEPLFSSIAVLDAQGKPVNLPKPHTEDGGLVLVVVPPPLPPGTYTVVWHATSVDTHKTEGKFNFTVGK
jgi:methionine-rich copper-binding protein CopC